MITLLLVWLLDQSPTVEPPYTRCRAAYYALAGCVVSHGPTECDAFARWSCALGRGDSYKVGLPALWWTWPDEWQGEAPKETWR